MNLDKELKRSRAQNRLFWGILFFVALSAACGKRTAQVNPPVSPPPSTAPSQVDKSAKQQVPSTAPKQPLPSPDITGGTVEPSAPATQTVSPAIDTSREPVIRIGLITAATEVRISSAGDYYVMEKVSEAARKLLTGEVRVRLERQGVGASPFYQIQVASFSHPENAEALQKKLSKIFDLPVRIQKSLSSNMNQVRIGEFPTREDAQAFLKTLNAPEYRRAFIVRETSMTTGVNSALAIRAAGDFFQLSETGFLFLPSSDTGFLCVNGKPYRGLLDVIVNKKNKITVINQLGIEDYLLGVVPAEINPRAYPEYEALAALSIASRTYALHNKGQYRSEDYDLTDDTRTQVYGGVNAEKAATNEAVRGTRGLAVYYREELINAMYMSTCGGRTEDFANVYDAAPVPYLQSVFCAIEGGPAKGEITIEGGNELEQVILTDDGSVGNRNLELARILGLLEFDSGTAPEFFTDPIRRDEAARLIEKAKKIANKAPLNDPRAKADADTRAGFLQFAAESFWGADEIEQKISPRDVDYYMTNLKDGTAVPERARHALVYLMQAGLWSPYPDNTVRPDVPIRRCDAFSLLLRWIESARPDILTSATFVEARSGENDRETEAVLGVKRNSRTREFPLPNAPSLFRLDLGRSVPVDSVRIIGNEKIAFHLDSSGGIDFLEVALNPTGASSDRYSPAATWDVRFTRSDLKEKLRSLADSIGEFADLKPARFGKSGRVIQVEIVGSRRAVVLNGYNVRGALGLKDTLYTITRERNPDGSIASFTFHGRGFGHGVGLCQTGAFGMARAGRSYEEILKHYYQGVDIRKAY